MSARDDASRPAAVSDEGMARIRVYTRTGAGERRPMVGLIPRESLEEIRSRFRAAAAFRSGSRSWRVAARVKRLEVVLVKLRGGEETVAGRRVLLGVSLRENAASSPAPARSGPRSRILRHELEAVVLEADRIKDAAARDLVGT